VITQSVWKLNCGVSVGGQTILGISVLVRDPEWEHEYEKRRDQTQVQSCLRRL